GSVAVRAIPMKDREGMVLFTFSDTGIGIPEDKLLSIFKMFEQADPGSTRKYGGTGLGLAICKQIVEAMHGRIWANNNPDGGSTFHCTAHLPAAPRQDDETSGGEGPHSGASDAASKPPPKPLQILLAEDDASSCLLISALMEDCGHTVLQTETGRKALEIWESRPIDLVLMDLQMPDMNGFETARAIREREKTTGKHVPIIAVTANALADTHERCLQIGMDYVLTKPISGIGLRQVIEQFAY
ncbi:MAG: response regulator, partial [Spartobacteria bacterium]|nr:response regulator [Spartobacteria bacterium]